MVGVTPSPLTRLGETEVSSRYAGAMLLHAFLTRLGAEEILSSLPVRAARHYDAAALVVASTFSFALGTSSVEGTKHLAWIHRNGLVIRRRRYFGLVVGATGVVL